MNYSSWLLKRNLIELNLVPFENGGTERGTKGFRNQKFIVPFDSKKMSIFVIFHITSVFFQNIVILAIFQVFFRKNCDVLVTLFVP